MTSRGVHELEPDVWDLLAQVANRVTARSGDEVQIGVEPCGELGSLSRLDRIYVQTRSSTNLTSLVLKREPSASDALSVVATLDGLAREHGFYSCLPDVAAKVSMHCWHSSLSPDGKRLRIILDDAGEQSIPPQAEGCEPGFAEKVIAALAMLHTMTAESQRPSHLSWCPAWTDAGFLRLAEDFRTKWPLFEDKHSGTLPPDAMRTAGRFARRMPDLVAEWERRTHPSVIHGDARLDNTVVHPDGSVRLIDWQMASWGEGAFDVAHFIAGSLTIDNRRRSEATLLDYYLESCASDGKPSSRHQFVDDVRRCLLMVLPLNIIFGVTPAANPQVAASRLEVLVRYFTAISDYSCDEFVTI